MKIGIVGLPNVGKSTIFKALTRNEAKASNYPFCTIDPNIGIVEVPDERLNKLARLYNSQKVVPAMIEFVDIAGLVKNAHKGEGLGNKFLSHIREVDAIAHVIRNFKNSDISHIKGKINPDEDLKTIETELSMADINTLEKTIDKLDNKIKANSKESIKQKIILENILSDISQDEKPDLANLNQNETKFIKSLNLLSLKPELYIENISEVNLAWYTNNLSNQLELNGPHIKICAKLEADLADLSPLEAKEYLNQLNIKKTGLNQLILESYKLLNLITFFTAGPKEAHAWTIKKGTMAPQAAGKIHTDFEIGFIRAEIINWQDLIDLGGEVKAKEQGKMRVEGKNYIIQDGDVAYFRFNK